MDLRFRTDRVGDTAVLVLDGIADLAGLPVLHRALATITDRPGTVAVDLDGLAALDDAAAGLLVGAAARARGAGGELVLVATAPRIVQRIEHLWLDRVVRVTASVAAAGRG
jgi:anti-anti-sigma factor